MIRANRRQLLLVRSDLIELADLLERADDPDPECVATLRELLRNGCDSPLYNADLHISELRARLYFARRRLRAEASVRERLTSP